MELFSRPAEGPDVVLRYADHADGLIDVFFPPSLGRPAEPAPLLIFIHGGFWRQEWDRLHIRPLAVDLTLRGFVVAAPEYRRTGGLGGWPQTGADIAVALAHLPQLIEDVSPGRIDPAAPVTVCGHSAGGHLALWAGLRAGPARVRRVVALAAVTDLRECARLNLDGGAAQDLVGGRPDDVPDRYDDADPLAALTPESPEVVMIHGTLDQEVPIAMARTAATRHPQIDYRELAGIDHFALIDPLSSAWQQVVLPAIRD